MASSLIDLVKQYRLQDRVQIELGFHPRERLARWVNRSLACAYIPFDEDYGYVTLEAFYAGKPVITTEDAGGVLDFVRDRATGLVASPDAESLAAAHRGSLHESRGTPPVGTGRSNVTSMNATSIGRKPSRGSSHEHRLVHSVFHSVGHRTIQPIGRRTPCATRASMSRSSAARQRRRPCVRVPCK